MKNILWWVRQSLLIIACGLILLFGIHLLISAYHLNNPFWFIMTFFASNLVILISAALLVGLVIRMMPAHRKSKEE